MGGRSKQNFDYCRRMLKSPYPKTIKLTRIHINKLTELFPAFLLAEMPLMPAWIKEGNMVRVQSVQPQVKVNLDTMKTA